MRYLIPFDLIARALNPQPRRDGLMVEMPLDDILDIIRHLLRGIDVDEAWYRAAYPGVAQAIDRGVFRSAKDHFIEHGYFDGNLPFEISVDNDWYLETYAGIRNAIAAGTLHSAQDHFQRHGYREGRFPNAEVSEFS